MFKYFFLIYLLLGLGLFAGGILFNQYHFFRQQAAMNELVFVAESQEYPSPLQTGRNALLEGQIQDGKERIFTPSHYVNFAFLNVRSEPTIYSPLRKKIYNGEKVFLFKKINPDWCQIEISRFNLEGYAACRYLRSLP